MSKQRVFWGKYVSDIRHLWRYGFPGSTTACGLYAYDRQPSRKGDKCKNCLRAIKN